MGRNSLNALGLGIGKINNKIDLLEKMYFTNSCETVSQLINSYSDLFDNQIGTFNKFEVPLKLKEGAVPKFYKARPVTFALKLKIENEIKRLVENNVLVPIEFSELATPIVPVLKANGAILICGDFKLLLIRGYKVSIFPCLE